MPSNDLETAEIALNFYLCDLLEYMIQNARYDDIHITIIETKLKNVLYLRDISDAMKNKN